MSEYDFDTEPTGNTRFGTIGTSILPLGVRRGGDELTTDEWIARLLQVRADLSTWLGCDFDDSDPKSLLNAIDSAILDLADPAQAGTADFSLPRRRAGHSTTQSRDDNAVAEHEDEGSEDFLAAFAHLETPRTNTLEEFVNGDLEDEKRVH